MTSSDARQGITEQEYLDRQYEVLKGLTDLRSRGFWHIHYCRFDPELFADLQARGWYIATYMLFKKFVEEANMIGGTYNPDITRFLEVYKEPVEAVLNGTWGK